MSLSTGQHHVTAENPEPTYSVEKLNNTTQPSFRLRSDAKGSHGQLRLGPNNPRDGGRGERINVNLRDLLDHDDEVLSPSSSHDAAKRRGLVDPLDSLFSLGGTTDRDPRKGSSTNDNSNNNTISNINDTKNTALTGGAPSALLSSHVLGERSRGLEMEHVHIEERHHQHQCYSHKGKRGNSDELSRYFDVSVKYVLSATTPCSAEREKREKESTFVQTAPLKVPAAGVDTAVAILPTSGGGADLASKKERDVLYSVPPALSGPQAIAATRSLLLGNFMQNTQHSIVQNFACHFCGFGAAMETGKEFDHVQQAVGEDDPQWSGFSHILLLDARYHPRPQLHGSSHSSQHGHVRHDGMANMLNVDNSIDILPCDHCPLCGLFQGA